VRWLLDTSVWLRAAAEVKRPFFAVVLDDEGLKEREIEHGMDVVERDHPEQFRAFGEKVLSRTSSFFRDPKDVKLAIHKALRDVERRPGVRAWVSAH
jgi:hypothetical protein